MQDVFLNGRMVPRDDARVSAFDAGITHGVGLFETLSATLVDDEPSVARLYDHLDRLTTSAKVLGLSTDLRPNPLAEAVLNAVRSRGLDRQRVRLTITGGDLNMLARSDASGHDPTILIDCQPATDYPPEMFEKGVAVALADTRANPLNPFEGHKTLNYWWRLTELRKAAARGAAEALVFSVTNHAVGGCVSNVFCVRDGDLLTPIARGEEVEGAIPSPVLPGVTRKAIFDLAHDLGIVANTRMLSLDDLTTADELFLTNSSWGILPVVNVEGQPIGAHESAPTQDSAQDEDRPQAQPGEMTRRLREALASASPLPRAAPDT